MTAPVPKVELGFGSTWLTADASISWTDVSAYVRVDNGRSVDIGKGRSAERDTFDAGTMTITFDNRTRLFDPDYAAGTWYGQLKPGVPIRLRRTAVTV